MLHRLLACFALLTGLTIAGAPSYARDAGVASAQAEQSVAAATAQSVAAIVLHGEVKAGGLPDAQSAPANLAQVAFTPLTVRLRIDRAHE